MANFNQNLAQSILGLREFSINQHYGYNHSFAEMCYLIGTVPWASIGIQCTCTLPNPHYQYRLTFSFTVMCPVKYFSAHYGLLLTKYGFKYSLNRFCFAQVMCMLARKITPVFFTMYFWIFH